MWSMFKCTYHEGTSNRKGSHEYLIQSLACRSMEMGKTDTGGKPTSSIIISWSQVRIPIVRDNQIIRKEHEN